MRVGLAAIGIGAGAGGPVLRAVASTAEREGFSTLWAGEHVVLVDGGTSRYPYATDGRLAVPPDTDWLDPLIALSVAAGVTETIRLATGVLLLPEHNPVLVAKQVASLDHLSGGRAALGVGIGWSREEFETLGVPFERRGQRTAEYVTAMRRLWSDDPATFEGELVGFAGVHCNPKPRHGRVPVLVGGNSDVALRRAASWGDGWYGFDLSVAEAAERITALHAGCIEAGRSPSELEIVVAPFSKPCRPDDLAELAAAGVDEIVIVAEPPPDPEAVGPWGTALAGQWVAEAGRHGTRAR